MGTGDVWNNSGYNLWPQGIVQKRIKQLLEKRAFSINEFISISCFKDFTPTLLQCYWSFTNFIIAQINPIVHKIIPRITCKKLVFEWIYFHIIFGIKEGF